MELTSSSPEGKGIVEPRMGGRVQKRMITRAVAWIMTSIFAPLMVVSPLPIHVITFSARAPEVPEISVTHYVSRVSMYNNSIIIC